MSQAPGPQDDLDPARRPGAQADLPIIGDAGVITPAGGGAATSPATPAPSPRAPVPGASADSSRTMFSIFGDTRRSGTWQVPAHVRAVDVFGDTVLDLREARFESAEVTVEAGVLFGDLKVIVPPGADVDLGGVTIFGDHRHDHRPGTPPPGFPRVRVTGWSLFGDIKVRCLEVGEADPGWKFWKK